MERNFLHSNRTVFAADTAVKKPVVHHLTSERRAGHVLVCGAGSKFKDQLQRSLMVQDILRRRGVAVIDTTGRFAADLLDSIPPWQAHQTYYLNPTDPKHAVGFNPFRGVPVQNRPRAAQDLVELFRDIWSLSYDHHPLLLTFLRMAALVLFDCPNSSLLTMYEFFRNEDYRKRAVAQCTNGTARSFWEDFETWPARDRRDKPQPVLTRLQAFVADPYLRAVVGQIKAPLDFAEIVSRNQVVLIDLPARRLGGESAMLLGSLMATRLRLALDNYSGSIPFYSHVPDCHRLHAGLCSRLYQNAEDTSGVVLSVDSLANVPAAVQANLQEAETVLAFRQTSADSRQLAARFDLPQSEQTLQTLEPDRLAASHVRNELRAIDFELPRFRQRRSIQRRSQNVLCVPRRSIDAKLDRYFLPKPKLEKTQTQRKAQKQKPAARRKATGFTVTPDQLGQTIFSTHYGTSVRVVEITKDTVTVQLPDGQVMKHKRG